MVWLGMVGRRNRAGRDGNGPFSLILTGGGSCQDKFHPLEPPSFAEIKSKYGKALGEVIEAQFSQLWLVVARGNPESLSQLTLGSSQESLFSEIFKKDRWQWRTNS